MKKFSINYMYFKSDTSFKKKTWSASRVLACSSLFKLGLHVWLFERQLISTFFSWQIPVWHHCPSCSFFTSNQSYLAVHRSPLLRSSVVGSSCKLGETLLNFYHVIDSKKKIKTASRNESLLKRSLTFR